MKDWWDLPGPSRYVADAVHAIRNGDNVVLALPEHVPEGLIGRVNARLGTAWAWDDLHPHPGRRPLDVLYERYMPDEPADATRSAGRLAERPDLRYRVWHLTCSCPEAADPWLGLIESYRAACHGSGTAGHAQFVIALRGQAARGAPDPDTLLTKLACRGTVGSLDLLLYAALVLQGRGLDHLPRQVSAATMAALAGWDPHVVDRFASAPDIEGALERPVPTLREIADERGWTPDTETSWEAGHFDEADGLRHEHPSLLALRGDHAELDRRRWRGQVSILFPYLDDRRQDLIRALNGHLTAPYTARSADGRERVRRRVEELEFTDIVDQLRDTPGAPQEAVNVAIALRELRNDLAHFDPVSSDRYTAPFINRIRRIR